jgi:RNA:NAD 2'-phosphotransferase (TPT1/KptA family)
MAKMYQHLTTAAKQKNVHSPVTQSKSMDVAARHHANHVIMVVDNVKLFFCRRQFTGFR